MRRTTWAWVRILGGAAVLGVLVWRVGAGPFVSGLRTVSFASILAAVAITAVTTVAAARRWILVARGLGVELTLGTAVAAYYRSQFLNTALPGGVLGDVHRAVRHGQDAGDVGLAARAVAWERAAGQIVQILVAVLVLAVLPSPVRSSLPLTLALAASTVLALTLLVRALPTEGPSRLARALRAVTSDVRAGLLARSAWPGVAGTSLVVLAGHTALFLVAARTAGVDASLARLLPLTTFVLLCAAVPVNIGGWGPREGVAAWIFAAAGLGAGHGVAAATVFGVLVLVAALPGAAVLAIGALHGREAPPPARPLQPVTAGTGGGRHG